MPSISVPTAIIGAGALSAGASLYGSSQQAGAAKDATALQSQMYQQNRADLAPWRQAGTNALAQLQYSLGIGPAPGTSQNGLAQMSGDTPGVIAARAAGPHSGNGLVNSLEGGLLGGGLFRKNASPLQDIAGALAAGKPISDQSWAMAGYGPGGAALGSNGLRDIGLVPNGPGTTGATQSSPYGAFQQSPGYQFAFNEGNRAVSQGMAARGLGQSGAAMKALTRYGQGTANQEWGNWLNRLQSVAGLGQTATGQGIQAGQTYADNTGSLGLFAASARGSGYTGAANALTGGVNQLAQLGYFGGGGSGGGGAGYYGTGAEYAGIDPVYISGGQFG